MQNNRLRYLREKEGLTQTNIAHALHIGQSTYNRYERGIREPDQETLKKIADYFHVSLDFLLKHDRPYTRMHLLSHWKASLLEYCRRLCSACAGGQVRPYGLDVA